MCICLKTSYLIYIVDSLIFSSRPIALYFMPEWSSSKMYVFSRYNTTFLHLKTLDSTSALFLWTILNSAINNKRCKNVWELNPEGRVFLYSTSAGSVYVENLTFFLLLISFPRMTVKVQWVLIFEVSNKFLWVGEFANMQSTNMRIDYHFMVLTGD